MTDHGNLVAVELIHGAFCITKMRLFGNFGNFSDLQLNRRRDCRPLNTIASKRRVM